MCRLVSNKGLVDYISYTLHACACVCMHDVIVCFQLSFISVFLAYSAPRYTQSMITTFTTAPVNIIFPSDLVDLLVSEGNQTTLTCTARGSPAPVFVWYRGSEVVDIADARLLISTMELSNVTTGFIDVTSLLSITQIDRTDFGVFRCDASNTILGAPSTDSQSYNLTVNCKLWLFLSIAILLYIQCSI